MEKLQEYVMDLLRFEEESVKKGFKDSYERYNEANAWYRDMLEMESNSVCASVNLQFNQSLAMTRQALRGTLTVYNGHQSEPLRDFRFIPTATEEVIRIEDGKEMPIGNFWQTDRTLIDGRDPLYVNMIHFADCSDMQSRTYLIRFSDRIEEGIEVERISGIPENGVSENSVERVAIQFNKPIDSESFSLSNIALYRNSEEVSCDGCSLTQVTPAVYNFDLSQVVSKPGDYRLVVNAHDVRGIESSKGKYGKCFSWTELGAGDCTVEVIVSPEGAGTISPRYVAGKFGEKVGTVIFDKANPKLLMDLSPVIYIVNGRRVYIR